MSEQEHNTSHDSEKVTVISAVPGPAITIVNRPNAGRNWKRTAGISAGVVMCMCFMAVGTLVGHLYWNSAAARGLLNGHFGSTFVNVITGRGADFDWKPEVQFPQNTSLNVLVLGVDHDYDNRDQIIWTSPGRSDSILLARFDFINKTVNALTIPRDTAVRIPGHDGIHKINAAHNFGGPALTIETIKSVFGVDTDNYVSVNFEGFQEIVNSIGGIDVNVPKKLDYDDNWGHLHIHLKPGYQHLNGYEAMGFVRMRHSDSDEMRSKRQHDFMEAMRTKVKSASTLGSLPNLINKVDKNLNRNLTNDQMLALVNFARTLPKENVILKTLPSFEGPSYVTVDSEKSEKLIQEMFFPNQFVALNIDAPDPNAVRSMNSPYSRGGRRNGRRSSPKKPQHIDTAPANVDPDQPPLNVETTDPGAAKSQDPVPPPVDGATGKGDNSATDKSEKNSGT